MVVTSENLIVTSNVKTAFNIEHSLKQKYPKKHDHFRFEDFYHRQLDTGIVTDWNEGRNIFASEDFIIGLI